MKSRLKFECKLGLSVEMFEFSDGYKASIYRLQSDLNISEPVSKRLGEHNQINLNKSDI